MARAETIFCNTDAVIEGLQNAVDAPPLPDLLASIDLSSRFDFANPAHLIWLGIPPAQLVGRCVWDVLDGRWLALVATGLESALNGRPMTVEASWSLGDAGARVAELRCLPRQDPWGRLYGAVMIGVDVSARRALERSQSALVQALRAQIEATGAEDRTAWRHHQGS